MMLKGSDGRDLAVRQLKKSKKSEKEEREENPCKKPNPCDKGEICERDGSGYTCVTKSKCHQERTASFHFYPHSSFLPSYPLPNQTPQKLPSLEVSRSSVVSLNSSHSSNPLMHLIPFSNLNSQLAVAQTVAQAVAQAVTAAVLTVDVSLSMMYLTIALNAK